MSDKEVNSHPTAVNEKAQKELNDWVHSLAALEGHIEEAMDKQLQLKVDNTEIKQLFQYFHDTVKASKDRSQQYLETIGTPGSHGIVERGAELLGTAAGLIDKLRNDSPSKSLRDDYTAFNHAAIGYAMLHTTALAVEDQATATFAEQGLRTYAGLVQKINDAMPAAVLDDLKANTDMPVAHEMITSQARKVIDDAWRETTT